jgi:hypothetical protein
MWSVTASMRRRPGLDQPMADGSARRDEGVDRRHQVDVEGEAPQGGLDLRRLPHQVHDVQLVGRQLAVPRLRDAVGDEPVGLTSGRLVHGEEEGGAALAALGQIGEHHVPPARRPVDVAGLAAADAVVHGREELGRGLGVDHPHAAARLDGPGEGRVGGVDGDLGGGRGPAVPEAPVDQRLRRQEDGERLTPGRDVVQLVGHHAGEHTLAPVGGQHAHRGHAGSGDGGQAGEGELHGPGVGRAHDVAGIEGGHRAVRLGRHPPGGQALVRQVLAEGASDSAGVLGVLVLGDGPDLDVHPTSLAPPPHRSRCNYERRPFVEATRRRVVGLRPGRPPTCG